MNTLITDTNARTNKNFDRVYIWFNNQLKLDAWMRVKNCLSTFFWGKKSRVTSQVSCRDHWSPLAESYCGCMAVGGSMVRASKLMVTSYKTASAAARRRGCRLSTSPGLAGSSFGVREASHLPLTRAMARLHSCSGTGILRELGTSLARTIRPAPHRT